ncbi:MAG: G5 domain-containing protein, partial [Peptoniphilus sp.]
EYTEKKPFTYDVQFDPDFYKNYPDAKDNYKIVTEGKVGEKTTKWTIKNSEIVGEPEIIKNTDPTNAVIKVGQKDYTGTITHTESHEVPFEVEYKYSNELEAGQTKVEQKGEKGSYDVEYSQKIKNGEKDGELTSTKKNEKAAKKEIIVIGTKPVTKVVEKPFNTEYVYDENLESGKTEEVTPGKNGKVTITTSYDKDQKKVVTSETEEAGQNRVVKIGGKTNGTEKVKEEIPFEVEVRKDPSLKKGEWKYATDDEGNELKGEKGEQEKTLTIVNSKVTETSEPTVTKKAKNAVVLVGEGTNDGTHEIKEKKELPFETKIEYDENLEAGQRQETGGEPGEQERTNILVIKDGKVTETKEGEFKTTKDPVDKVIKIGIKPVVKEVEKPFETEYIYDENVEMGKEEEVTPGEKGKVTITTSYDKDQNKLVTKEETKDPVKRVVKVGTKPVTKVVEKPFNTEYQYDENLEAGKTEEVTQGKNGKVTITTSYDETQKKIVTSETEEAGQNRVVKIGGKTNGTIEILDKVAYEVEVIKDDTLDAGTFKTVQEGIDGEKKTTLTIENSKEIKDSRKEEITKQPVKKIIKVGTKPNDKMCPAPENPSTPDNNKPNKPNKPNEPGILGERPDRPKAPNTTNKPGDKTPSEPGRNTPNKPGENPSDDPKNPPQESPENPKLEKENDPKVSEAEKVK